MKLKHRLIQVGIAVLVILGVLVIERKTGIFTKVFSKVPGVKDLLA